MMDFGRSVVALACDEDVLHTHSGKVVMAWEMAEAYGYTDPTTGVVPNDKVMRGLKVDLAQPPPHWNPDVPLEDIIPQMIRRGWGQGSGTRECTEKLLSCSSRRRPSFRGACRATQAA